MITFLGTKMPRVDLPLEKMVKPIHHQSSGKKPEITNYSSGD